MFYYSIVVKEIFYERHSYDSPVFSEKNVENGENIDAECQRDIIFVSLGR
jgi:hypothetical protein